MLISRQVFFLTFSGLVIFQQRTSNGCLDRPESIQSTTVAATATGGAEYKVCMIGSAGAGKTATIAIYGLQMPPNGVSGEDAPIVRYCLVTDFHLV